MASRFDRFLCPACEATLRQEQAATYSCPACGRTYPIMGGIPRFVEALPDDLTQVQRVFDFEHRRYQESSHTRFSPALVQQFLDDCQLPAGFFRGLDALDAGCGSGRWSYALAELGAHVTAFDLTTSGAEITHAQMGYACRCYCVSG